MTAKAFVEHVERTYDVAIGPDGDRLLVVGHEHLPRHVKFALIGHTGELLTFFRTGRDFKLSLQKRGAELEALGFYELRPGVWCFSEGDEKGDLLMHDLLDPEKTAAEHEAVLESLRERGLWPQRPVEEVEGLTEVSPGVWTWTQRSGRVYRDPFPKLFRIRI